MLDRVFEPGPIFVELAFYVSDLQKSMVKLSVYI